MASLAKFSRPTLFMSAFLVLSAGCGGGGGGPGDLNEGTDGGVDATAVGPSVLSTSPANGATGVHEDAVFVFRFSEPMNTAATVAAYESVSLPASAVSFQWNDAGDTLSVIPKDPLPYAEGDELVGANGFSMRISTAATNVAGDPLVQASELSFSTLRRIILTAPRVAALTGRVNSLGAASTTWMTVGDLLTNGSSAVFMTFSLDSVPAGVTIESARIVATETEIVGTPDADLGQLNAQHVLFDTLDSSAFAAELLPAPPNSVPVERSAGPAPFLRSATVTEFVQEDLDNRAARSDRTQARLRYATLTDSNGDSDYVSLLVASAALEIRYLAE